MEISDRYPNDSDIICKFTYNADDLAAMTSDRIGLYRVPFATPHEYLAFSWVSDAIGTGAADHYSVNFKVLIFLISSKTIVKSKVET